MRREFFLQFSQCDVTAFLDLAKNELSFGLNPARLIGSKKYFRDRIVEAFPSKTPPHHRRSTRR